MLYPELFKSLEQVRWNMETDIPWADFDGTKLTDEQAKTIKMNAITEWSALPATEMFLRDNRGDSDFSAFMSVWFFEEQKHSLVLMEYLRRFRPDMVPSEDELHNVRFEFDPAPPLETLMLHFCGEIRLNHWYRCAAEWHTEPVIKQIYKIISQDEARHGGAYLRYMKKALQAEGDTASAAFAKIGVLMGSARRTEKPDPARMFALTTHGSTPFAKVAFQPGDVFVFGSETKGLATALRESFPTSQRIRLPMQPDNRSLNLSNTVAVVVYEAWRQNGFAGGS